MKFRNGLLIILFFVQATMSCQSKAMEIDCKAVLRDVVKRGQFGEQRTPHEASLHFIPPHADIRDDNVILKSLLYKNIAKVFYRAEDRADGIKPEVVIMDQGAGMLVTLDEVAEMFWKWVDKEPDLMRRFHFWALTLKEGFLGNSIVSKWEKPEDGRPANQMTGIFGKFFEDLSINDLPAFQSLDLILDLLGVFSYSHDPGGVLNRDIELSKPDGIILIRTSNDTVVTETGNRIKIIEYLKSYWGKENIEGWLQRNPDLKGFINTWDWESPVGASIVIKNAGRLPKLPSLLRVKINDEWIIQEKR